MADPLRVARRFRLLPLGAALLAAVALAPAASADWLRDGGDPQLTDDVPLAAARAVGIDAATAPSLAVRWRADLDGPLVASPLYLDGTDGGEGTVYAATEAGSVYALRASDGSVIWQRKLPTFTTPDCGTYGVSSSGVVDAARGRLYVADADGRVYALDLATGADVAGWPVQLPIDTATGYVWGGLTLSASRLYVPVASYCDEPDPATGAFPTGGVTAIDVDTASIAGSFVVSGPDTLGGVWGYGGTSIDPLTGDLWTATGNSEPLGGASETQGYAEAVVELDPSLEVVAWNRPDGIPSETTDTDFGSTPLLFQPQGCPPLAAAYNKNGQLYVWRRDAVGAGPIWTVKIGPDDLDTPFVGEPSWSPDEQMLYVANARVYDDAAPDGVARYDAAVAFAVGAGCSFPDAPTWVADAGQGTKPPALVVGDAVFVAGGNSSSFSVLDAATGAVLHVFFLENTLYSPPILAGDEVVVGNSAGTLFAIAPPVPRLPAAPPHGGLRPCGGRASCAEGG